MLIPCDFQLSEIGDAAGGTTHREGCSFPPLSSNCVRCPFVADVSTFDGLQHMESAFRDENQKGRSCVDLYEVVQHCGNIVPRL